MNKNIVKAFLAGAFLCLASVIVSAQTKDHKKDRKPSPSAASTAVKVPIVVVGSAAKATWVTTKFTTQHFAKPVAKAVFIHATPAVTKFAVTNSAKYLLPFVVKLSIL